MKRFSDAQLQQIRTSIQNAESKTSAEIVPMVVSSSDHYWTVHWTWALVFSFIGSVAAYYGSHREENWSVLNTVVLQTVLGSAGFLLPFFSFLKRLSLPEKKLFVSVHRRCLVDFIDAGLLNTRDRTGVLIYISLFERRVLIVADRGISSKVSNDYWDEQVKRLAAGIRSGQGVAALCEVIAEVGNKLAPMFPKGDDDKNEIPDTLRLGHAEEVKE